MICATEKEYSYFVNAARSLYSEAKIVSQNYVPSFMRPSTVVIPSRYIGFVNLFVDFLGTLIYFVLGRSVG